MSSNTHSTVMPLGRASRALGSEAGFNLIEIMVVLVIIAGLAYLVGTNVIGKLHESRIATTRIQIKNLESGVKQFNIDQGFFPDTQQGLLVLVQEPQGGRELRKPHPPGGYLDGIDVPLDSWGSEYIYIGPDQTAAYLFEIISPGPDGTYPSDDDISNLETRVQ